MFETLRAFYLNVKSRCNLYRCMLVERPERESGKKRGTTEREKQKREISKDGEKL